MRFMVAPGLLLVTALTCVSCGKKEEKGPVQSESPKNEVTRPERLFGARKELRRAVKSNDTRALRMVIFENPDLSLNEPMEDGDTLLTYTLKKRFDLIRNILLEKGANPNQKTLQVDYPGFTPLMLAAHMGDVGSITTLLEYKADINAQDDLGDTALHKAIKNGYDEAAKTLVRSGSELTIENHQGRTALEVAAQLRRQEMTNFLQGLVNLEAGTPTLSTFRQIITETDIINYRKLVSSNPEILKEYAAINPLSLLVDTTNDPNAFEIAQSLLANKISADGPSDAELPPIVKAAKLGKIEFVRLFLRYNANIRNLDNNQRPALYYAIMNSDLDMVELLLNNGAPKKLELWKNGRKIKFIACRVADFRQKEITKPEELDMNHRIQLRLGCRWTR